MKRTAWIKVVLALACALGLTGLFACSGGSESGSASAGSSAATSDEDLIRADAESVLNSLVTKDFLAEAMRASDQAETFDSLGLDIDAFAEAMAAKFSFEVTSVEVNGDEAVASVDMSIPDFNEEAEALLEEKGASITESVSSGEMDAAEAMSAYMDVILETISSDEFPTEITKVDLDYTKTDGEWTMSDRDEIESSLKSVTESTSII